MDVRISAGRRGPRPRRIVRTGNIAGRARHTGPAAHASLPVPGNLSISSTDIFLAVTGLLKLRKIVTLPCAARNICGAQVLSDRSPFGCRPVW